MLAATAYTSADTITDILYVNFNEPTVSDDVLGTLNVGSELGEPVTVEEYIADAPVAKTVDEVETLRASNAPVFVIDDVQFLDELGKLSEPVSAVQFSTGTVEVENSSPQLRTQAACATKETYVFLKTSVSGSNVNVPTGTRVFVNAIASPGGPNVRAVKYVQDGGRVNFNLACDKDIFFTLEGYTNTGLTIHNPSNGGRIYNWSQLIAGTKILTADDVRGRVLNFGTSGDSISRLSQRVWFRVNQVYDWERTSYGSPYTNDRFALDIVYPARDFSNNARSRAAYGQMQIVDGDALEDPTLFHEFGHEVYYRRLLGGSQFEYYSREAVAGRGAYPLCAGSLSWTPWKQVDGCAGMLEGFALWFDAVATRALGTESRPVNVFQPEPRSTTFNRSFATPGRVAQYLWDGMDVHLPLSQLTAAEARFRDTDQPADFRNLGDKITSTDKNVKNRYAYIANFFTKGAPNEDLGYMWRYSIRPKLSADGVSKHCDVLEFNLVGRLYGCGN